jgi:septum formation protein
MVEVLGVSEPTTSDAIKQSAPLILASASPRRRALLAAAGIPCEVIPADVDESIHEDEAPAFAALRIALTKAEAIAASLEPGRVVVAADTMVVLGEEVFNKPATRDEARVMLQRLSGQTHTVITALFLMRTAGPCRAEAVTADVTFHTLTPEQIEAYIATGEADDKAGAYGLQGLGAQLVAKVEGDLSCVIGLPLLRLRALLLELNYPVPYAPEAIPEIIASAFTTST